MNDFTKKILSFTIGLCLSLGLLFGAGSLHAFCFAVSVVFNILAWIVLLTGVCAKPEVAESMRRHAWLSALGSVFSLYAMIASGHPYLAASSFMSTLLILLVIYGKKPEQVAQ